MTGRAPSGPPRLPFLARLVLAAIGGVVLATTLAPFFLWPLILLVWPGIAWLVEETTRERRPLPRAALVGWIAGFGYFTGGLFWIGEAFLVDPERHAWMMPFAVAGLPAGLALFWAAAAAAAVALGRTPLTRLVALWGALVLAEWLRAHILTGFPWNLPAHIWAGADTMRQAAAVLGRDGLSAWTLAIGLLPALALLPGRRTRAVVVGVCLPLALLAAQWAFGIHRLPDVTVHGNGPVVRIVQPNIEQREKWAPDKREEVFARYMQLTAPRGTPSDAGIDIVVWPELALPFQLDRAGNVRRSIGEALGQAWLVTGQQRAEGDRSGTDYFNSIMVLDPNGRIRAVYDKAHLVPFGEYLPAQSLLESIGVAQLTGIPGGFTPGALTATTIEAGDDGLSFAPLICYEILFDGRIPAGDDRPRAIVNVTNDAWFGASTGPHQHLAAARLRAVIEGLPVLRAANTGISAVIDAHGRLREAVALQRTGVIDSPVPPAVERPPGADIGTWLGLGAGIAGLGIALLRQLQETD